MRALRRKGPSRLMDSMQGRVEDVAQGLINDRATMNHSFEIDVDSIETEPQQARKVFGDREISELAESLRLHGQLAPILVRPLQGVRGRWIIVAGERRWRAAKQVGIPRLLAIEKTNDYDVASLIENIQREDLHSVEEARAILELSTNKGWSQREAARQIGKGLSDVNGMLAVARLPEDFLMGVLKSEHTISRNLLVELARLPDDPRRQTLLGRALAGELTILKLREEIVKANTPLRSKKPVAKKSLNEQSTPNISEFLTAIATLRSEALSAKERKALANIRDIINALIK